MKWIVNVAARKKKRTREKVTNASPSESKIERRLRRIERRGTSPRRDKEGF